MTPDGDPSTPAEPTRPVAQEPLRRRLAALACMAVMPMVLLFAAQGYADYRADRDRAGQSELGTARSMAAIVERELGGAVASLQALAISPRLQGDDLPGFRQQAMRFAAAQPEGSTLVLLDASGQQLVNTRLPDGAPLPRRTPAINDKLTAQVFRTAQPVVSDLFPRSTDGTLIVTAEVPVMRGGQVIYDLALRLLASRFTSIIAEQHLAPGVVASIIDGRGLHVARLPDPDHMVGTRAPPALAGALAAGEEGVLTSRSVEGTPLLTAFSHVRQSGWSVAIGVPESLLRRELQVSLEKLAAAGALGLACSLGLAALLAQRVLIPMRALAELAADPSRPPSMATFDLCEAAEVAAALRGSIAGRDAALLALRTLNDELGSRVRHEIRNREQVQSQLAQAQRMEALGQLAGGIAHDFNNVLQAVTSGLSLIRRRADDAEAVRRLAGLSADAAGRGAAITGRLLTFARRGDIKAAAVDPVALLREMREMLAHTLGGGVTVRVESDCDLPPMLVDRPQLETALVNLAVNARDAMPDGGTLCLRAECDRGPQSVADGAFIRLDVTDDGAGMPAATLARASEPFFTTKPAGSGTGLGLAMARGFAEQSGGALRIRSAMGGGTTVSLWFPCAPEGRVAVPPEPIGTAASPAGIRRLLMVDDDSMVREVLAHELADRGFQVTTAASGASALSLLDGGVPADLLVTDYAMPGMNGLTLIEEVRRRRPDLPAVLLTGYAEADLELDQAQDARTAVLRKPVSGEELARRANVLS